MNRHQRRALNADIAGKPAKYRVAAAFGAVENGPWHALTADERERSMAIARAAVRDGEPLYHGGTPALGVGDMLLPPAQTGADPRQLGTSCPSRMGLVFVTTTSDIARNYARGFPGGGAVYRVEPLGDLEVDPLCVRAFELARLPRDVVERAAGFHLCCPSARIVELVEACDAG